MALEIQENDDGFFHMIQDGKDIARSEYNPDDDWWDDSHFDYEEERELDRGAGLEIGGFNDNFEELNLPDPKRGIEVKQCPWSWY